LGATPHCVPSNNTKVMIWANLQTRHYKQQPLLSKVDTPKNNIVELHTHTANM